MSWKDVNLTELERAFEEIKKESRAKDERIQLLEDKLDEMELRFGKQLKSIQKTVEKCKEAVNTWRASAIELGEQIEQIFQEHRGFFQYMMFRLDNIIDYLGLGVGNEDLHEQEPELPEQ